MGNEVKGKERKSERAKERRKKRKTTKIEALQADHSNEHPSS
jgi:hypothetical protein